MRISVHLTDEVYEEPTPHRCIFITVSRGIWGVIDDLLGTGRSQALGGLAVDGLGPGEYPPPRRDPSESLSYSRHGLDGRLASRCTRPIVPGRGDATPCTEARTVDIAYTALTRCRGRPGFPPALDGAASRFFLEHRRSQATGVGAPVDDDKRGLAEGRTEGLAIPKAAIQRGVRCRRRLATEHRVTHGRP